MGALIVQLGNAEREATARRAADESGHLAQRGGMPARAIEGERCRSTL
jgi:hypothetical protein